MALTNESRLPATARVLQKPTSQAFKRGVKLKITILDPAYPSDYRTHLVRLKETDQWVSR